MIRDESTVYHPIGAGSNVYKTNFLEYIQVNTIYRVQESSTKKIFRVIMFNIV